MGSLFLSIQSSLANVHFKRKLTKVATILSFNYNSDLNVGCNKCRSFQRSRILHTSSSPCYSTPHSGKIRLRPNEEIEDPFLQFREPLDALFKDIRRDLGSRPIVRERATYYFDGRGKSLRPLIVLLMSKAVNHHKYGNNSLLKSQEEIAKIAEMLHAASLLHDDVIDGSDTRRGKPSVHTSFSHKQSVMIGDYVLSVAATNLARLRHEEVIVVLSQVLVDLIQGEFMQLGSKENENERFAHYLKKTFNKTASLIAFSCKATALLADCSPDVQEIAFQYGKNAGVAFQLIDDLLDFTSTANSLGKPNFNDLKSGLATAPVLFAVEKFPELNPMIMRRFEEPGDVQRALECVLKSDGLEQTKFLAEKHTQEAVKQISKLDSSLEQKGLIMLTDKIINREK